MRGFGVIFAIMMLVCRASTVWSQQFVAIEEDELAKPISLLEKNADVENSTDLEVIDPTISYYVQNLSLSPDQLDLAQQISEAEQIKKEDLLRQIEALRREAYNLEAGSLIAFEAILDDAQRVTFHELRTEMENNLQKSTSSETEVFENKQQKINGLY